MCAEADWEWLIVSTETGNVSVDRSLAIELVPLCRGTWVLGSSTMLQDTPAGTRLIAELHDGRVEGERLTGNLTGRSTADWITIGPGKIGTIDLRALIKTDDGAVIYMQGAGRLDMSRDPSSRPFAYSAVTFETGDDRYRWLNRIQAVCKGILDGKAVHDEFYEVV